MTAEFTEDIEQVIVDDSQVEVDQPDTAIPDDGRQWFIVQCYSNQEHRVQARIQSFIDENNLQSRIFQVLVPEEDTVEIKNNKRQEKTVRIFPGYVFIQMLFDNDVYFGVRSISGVSKFIGSKNQPTPVTEDEILKVLRKMGEAGAPKIDVDFEVGEVIKVVSGPFRGYSGPISEISPEKGHLKALISVFGRETPVQLDFDQVEKAVE